MRTPARRRGVTLIEVLVAVGIIGLLCGLLLPAAQSAREAARRSKCQNNLRQIALAAHGYQAASGAFPPASINNPDFADRPALEMFREASGGYASHGFLTFLLSHVEQTDLAVRYDFRQDWGDATNQPVVSERVRVFECPSALPVDHRYPTAPPSTPWGSSPFPATTDYGAVTRVDETAYLKLGLPVVLQPGSLAIATKNRFTRASEVVDGLSHTLLASEAGGRPTAWRALWSQGVRLEIGGAWAGHANDLKVNGRSEDGASSFASPGDPAVCPLNCSNEGEIYSFHSRGAHAAMGDGSVRFLLKTMPLAVLLAMTTRAGGEPPVE